MFGNLNLGIGFGKIGLPGVGGAIILLTGSTVADSATVGTVVGTLSVIGATGTPTYVLVDDAGGKYQISGSQLQVAGALTAGTDTIEVSVSGMTPTPPHSFFSITVTTAPPGASGSPIGLLLALTYN